jgi:energy-coupling factor transporter ATP-binding protein EcfA2
VSRPGFVKIVNQSIVGKCTQDFAAANLRCEEEFVRRFVAALLAKRFVILTGLAGSGKTKLAQAFARWLTPFVSANDPFAPGTQLSNSYRIMDADRLSIEFWNKDDEKVVLPRKLIEEWADFLTANPTLTDTPSKEVREHFIREYETRQGSKFAKHAIFWDSHLKPAALALIVARKTASHPCLCYEVVSVGADWTSSEHVLGYPDGLDKSRYVRTRALDLILRAVAEPEVPHFLILDEMNLSHVERYFADLLSALESGESVHLHSDKDANGASAIRDGVPGEIHLPANLFIVGTVNVDETTYMFSPKVLDRANVLEFRVSGSELKEFLKNPAAVDFAKLNAAGAEYGKLFTSLAQQSVRLIDDPRGKFEAELCLFFEVLKTANAEFGFRVAKEAAAFLYFHKLLSGDDWDFKAAMDAQIFQKLLPKLHGSRNVLEPILWALAALCFPKRTWELDDDGKGFSYLKSLRVQAEKALRMEDESLDPLGLTPMGSHTYPPAEAFYPLSFEKILRMLERLRANGFTSFAEA